MKQLISLVAFILLAVNSNAQTKILSMEDAMVRNRSTLAPANLRQLQFIYGTDDYVYLKNIDGKDIWVRGNTKTGEQPFLTLQQLNEKLRIAGSDTLSAFPTIQFNKSGDWSFTVKGNRIALNPLTNKSRITLDKNIAQKAVVDESSTGYIAYVDNHNLHVSDGSNTNQVTKDGNKDIVYGKSVHREEFGITKGTFWSNSGKLLAFYRMDQGMVTDYPIINWNTYPATVEMIKYPMAGGKSHHVTVGVYDAAANKTVYLQTGEPADQYLTNIAWSPDDKFIFIAVVNREQDHIKLNQYDAATGGFIKTLFEEKDERYIEPMNPMLFLKSSPAQFIWQSNRDGYNHLYLYDITGKLIRQLTKGTFEVTEIKGFDSSGEHLFYVSTEESPITKNLYQLNLKSGKVKRITTVSGVHNTQLSHSGKHVIDMYSNPETPRAIQLIETSTGKTTSILTANNPLADYALGQMSIFTIPNAEGVPLFCRMYKPINFDSTKQYPVIAYWYGGPHAQMITNGFNGGATDYWFQYLAQRGFIVFSLDPRGSDNRGKAFEQAIFRKAGEAQMDDMISGVNYLKSLPYVDTKRMGLFGWSYGGFMTTNFMLTHPGIFKTAVAGGPVIDWSLYEIMYTERYMDTPKENPEGYATTDLSKRVDKLKGNLMLIHGTQDPVVVQQHSVKFVKAAIDKGVQVDYMIYPGHEHNVTGKDRAHLYQKVTDYLLAHLQ